MEVSESSQYTNPKDYFELLTTGVKQQLAGFFICLGQGEIQIETQRQILSSLSTFNPKHAFRRIDVNHTGYITAQDLDEFLNRGNMELQCSMLIQYFDSDPLARQQHQYLLDFHKQVYFTFTPCFSFLSIVLPCKNTQLRAQIMKKVTAQKQPQTPPHIELINETVERELVTLLMLEINLLHRLELMKKDLFCLPSFKIRHCFKAINQQEPFDKDSLHKFILQVVGDQTPIIEIKGAIRRLDLNGDSKVSFSEFCESLNPINLPVISQPEDQPITIRRKLDFSHQQALSQNEYDSNIQLNQPFFTTKSVTFASQISEENQRLKHHSKENCPNYTFTLQQSDKVSSPLRSKAEPPVIQKNKAQEQRMKKELSRTFLDNIYLEKEVEKLKLQLASCQDFTCMEAHNVIFSQRQLNLQDFTDKLLSFAGKGMFDQQQAQLLYQRYGTPQIAYSEFCKMVLPTDSKASTKLLQRQNTSKLSADTLEILLRLVRALLSLAQAQEYVRLRLRKQMQQEGWTVKDIFKLLDRENKGWISIFDIEKLLVNHKRGGSHTLVTDIELIIAMYDMSGQSRRILVTDFESRIGFA